MSRRARAFRHAHTMQPTDAEAVARELHGVAERQEMRTANYRRLKRGQTVAVGDGGRRHIDDRGDAIQVLTTAQVGALFRARCADLGIAAKDRQRAKFASQCSETCQNGKLRLEGMFLGAATAALVAGWLLEDAVEVTHLLLGQNNLGDEGVSALARAIGRSKHLVVVDLSQNRVTPACAEAVFAMIATNQSIVSFNLGSDHGAQRNRLGREGCAAVCNALYAGTCLIQFLYLRGTHLGNSEVVELAAALQHYRYLHTLDLAWNRLEGAVAGKAIASLLERRPEAAGFVALSKLDLSNNLLGSEGFGAILEQLQYEGEHIDTLVLASNDIRTVEGQLFDQGIGTRIISVKHLVLDGNRLRPGAYCRLANLISMLIYLETLSLRDCLITDHGVERCFESLPALRRLRKVDFSHNAVTDAGIRSLGLRIGDRYVAAGRGSQLSCILFNANKITNEGVLLFFSYLERRHHIREVGFGGNLLQPGLCEQLAEWLKAQR